MKIQLSLLFILLSLVGYSQIKTFSPKGIIISDASQKTIAGVGTKTLLFADTIKANTLVPGKAYSFTVDLALSTPLVSTTTVTLEIKYGSSAINVIGAATLLGSLSSSPVRIRGDMTGKTMSSQLLLTTATQMSGGAISLTPSNAPGRNLFAVDATVDQPFTINVTLGGGSLGTSTLICDWVFRAEF